MSGKTFSNGLVKVGLARVLGHSIPVSSAAMVDCEKGEKGAGGGSRRWVDVELSGAEVK